MLVVRSKDDVLPRNAVRVESGIVEFVLIVAEWNGPERFDS